EFFYRNKRMKDGFHGDCKACSSARHKKYNARAEVMARARDLQNARYQNNPEHRSKQIAAGHNYRAAKRGAKGIVNPEQIQEQLKNQKCRCYYCSNRFERRYIYHIDHTFPLSKADGNDPINDISYLVLTCPD